MPYKDKEKAKEYKKEYYQKNKEYIKEYREIHNEHIKEQRRKYNQTAKRIKSNRILFWKIRGIGMNQYYDFDIIYDIFINTTHCDLCKVEFKGKGADARCLDHCHQSGEIRNILCRSCNNKRG